MAREFIDVTIGDAGRDAGKIFRITEMTAEDAEWWALRTLSLLVEADSTGELEKLAHLMAGETEKLSAVGAVAIIKLLAKADMYKVRPLWDEMRDCWSIVPQGDRKMAVKLADNSIEEVSTLLTLRMKTLELHFDFFIRSTQSLTV